MKRFKSAWRKCNLKKRISDEAVEAAFPCNINYLLHLFFIIGVQRIYEETVFSMEISGSAECYRVVRKISNSCRIFQILYSTIFPNIRACISMPMSLSFIEARYRSYGKHSQYLHK